MDSPEEQVVQLVNRARQEHGLGPLRVEPALKQAARAHVADMADFHYFSHHGRDGRGVTTRAKRSGYVGEFSGFHLGENIAMGYASAREAVEGWLASPGHRANILEGDFTETGVALAVDDEGVTYWAQVFGTR